NPRTAVLSEEGRQRVSAAAKAHWARYRELKAAGLPVPRVGRPKRPAAIPSPPSTTPEERRARAIRSGFHPGYFACNVPRRFRTTGHITLLSSLSATHDYPNKC